MSRDYFIHDAQGQRRTSEAQLPLRVGGKRHGGIVLPNVAEEQLAAFIAIADGHAYIQPASAEETVFHNDERLTESAWLKSGDRVQIGDALISWKVQGDKVLIDVLRQSELPDPRPPIQPPPDWSPSGSDDMPVRVQEVVHANGSKRVRRIVAVIISMLLLASIYLLASTPVVIRTKPELAVLKMKGFPPPLLLWGSRLVLPGRYTIEASHPGYVALSEEVEIVRDGITNLSYTLAELPGILGIRATPEVDLKLYIDDVESPPGKDGNVEIVSGNYQLRIETERYLAHAQQIEIQGYGKAQQLDINLQPAWASVSISSQPVGAEVLVDGRVAGHTPLLTDILQGRHEIRLTRPGFKPVTVMQSVDAGSDITLDPVQLEPVDGQLIVSSTPAGASITLDGLFQGSTPMTLNLVANTPHTLQLSKAGYSLAKQPVTLEPDDVRSIEVRLTAEYGTVFLTTQPADVALQIDGDRSDQSSGRLRLTTRQHTLTVSKPAHITQTLTVTPQKGVSQNIEVSLKTVEQQAVQKKIAKTPDAITTVSGQQLQLVKPVSSFTMGASRREAGRRANESRRLVQLNRPFYFARNEVTNSEYRRFRPSHDSGQFDGAGLNGEAQPVVNLGWGDAARYCNWLSKQQDLPVAYVEKNGKMVAINPMNNGYRLPTEAEWAWVARRLDQESEQRYPWKGSYPPALAVGNYADARIADTLADVVPGYDDGYRGTAPVASFPAWPGGFHDLGGNVAEWVHDYYAVYPGDAVRLVTDPSGPQSGEHRVVRGSGWRHGNITELRLSYRDYSNKPRYDLGFRVARYVE